MRHSFLVILIVLVSCSDRRQFQIDTIEVNNQLYEKELNRINRLIETKSGEVKLRKDRIYISSKLNWPQDVAQDFEIIEKKQGLDYDVFQHSLNFFSKYEYYKKLLVWIDSWEKLTSVEVDAYWKVIGSLGLNDTIQSKENLWSLLHSKEVTPEKYEFAASSYLYLGDTVLGMYAYDRLSKIAPYNRQLLEKYVPLLLHYNQIESARKITSFVNVSSEDTLGTIRLAQIHFEAEEFDAGHDLLRQYQIEKIYLDRAEAYQFQKLNDKALIMIDSAIAIDSSLHSLMTKADFFLYESKYWTARNMYQLILEKDSTYVLAKESLTNVDRKIAYLRSFQETRKPIPILEITPKKEIGNE